MRNYYGVLAMTKKIKKQVHKAILERYTRRQIADMFGYSYQTVANWFNPDHPAGMPVELLEPMGFCVVHISTMQMRLEDVITDAKK